MHVWGTCQYTCLSSNQIPFTLIPKPLLLRLRGDMSRGQVGEWDYMGPVGCLGPFSRQFQDLSSQATVNGGCGYMSKSPRCLLPGEEQGWRRGRAGLLRLWGLGLFLLGLRWVLNAGDSDLDPWVLGPSAMEHGSCSTGKGLLVAIRMVSLQRQLG